MRDITIDQIISSVAQLCIDANYSLEPDVTLSLRNALESEQSLVCKSVLGTLLENAEVAEAGIYPICQDTGMAVVFVDIGQDAHIVGGKLDDAINEGVRQGYDRGYLRKSMVSSPIDRVNTGDNTPAIIHYSIIPGDKLSITVAPKGAGSENMSRVAMLKPAQGLEGVKNFVVETVDLAGPNPCPPIVVGVGVGGNLEKACLMAKHALIRPIGESNPDPTVARIESDLLDAINGLGIGPQGFGGTTTALAVNVETFATHIASLPVAVNINCHVARHKTMVL